MRLLCNENIPGVLVDALKAAGHDVCWVRSERPGISDPEVLSWALSEMRICITFDKDFGELAARQADRPELAVILLRVKLIPDSKWANGLAAIISGRDDWPGHFAVISPGRVRLRPLPNLLGQTR